MVYFEMRVCPYPTPWCEVLASKHQIVNAKGVGIPLCIHLYVSALSALSALSKLSVWLSVSCKGLKVQNGLHFAALLKAPKKVLCTFCTFLHFQQKMKVV